MRITKELLLKFANSTVEKRVQSHRSTLLAAYLHGSITHPDFTPLGGITDIDLVLVWEVTPPEKREFARITDEIHLDITHHSRDMYRSPREMRTDPWMGPTIYRFKIVHDPSHILDFAQASVRDRFFEPTNVLERARKLAGRARDTWMTLLGEPSQTPESALKFLASLADAANAIALLNEAPPLAERSFLVDFYKHAQAIEKPALYLLLIEALGGGDTNTDELNEWQTPWEDAITHLHANNIPRILYHQKAVEALLASERPPDALWPILWQWTQVAQSMEVGSPAYHKWQDVSKKVGTIGKRFEQRLEKLDALLEIIEDVLTVWGHSQGIN